MAKVLEIMSYKNSGNLGNIAWIRDFWGGHDDILQMSERTSVCKMD